MLLGTGPHHSNRGYGFRSRLALERHAPRVDSYLKTGAGGRWLLPVELSAVELEQAQVLTETVLGNVDPTKKEIRKKFRELSRVLGGVALNQDGCWRLGRKRSPRSLAEIAVFAAETGIGTVVLDDPADIEYLRVCNCDQCINPRHLDLMYGRNTLVENKVVVNPELYLQRPDGTVETIWGDLLPSVEDSLELFIYIQNNCVPYVPPEQSLVTATSISQLRVHPLTGCFESWQYYCQPGERDGYGRLYSPEYVKFDTSTGEVLGSGRRGTYVAHRVLWRVLGGDLSDGKVLNHLCGYKRCCNPLHLESISSGQNNRHGIEMNRVISAEVKDKKSRIPSDRLREMNDNLIPLMREMQAGLS